MRIVLINLIRPLLDNIIALYFTIDYPTTNNWYSILNNCVYCVLYYSVYVQAGVSTCLPLNSECCEVSLSLQLSRKKAA